ncbi:hypothetical protein [Burkholderia cepacia]|uniref:hypothetical protein n=1 Tax=Burkholderia cepacia TaxID=292 RepID=UPI001CF1E99A|nr:hypothetical protein [Burkholderia cepacia]
MQTITIAASQDISLASMASRADDPAGSESVAQAEAHAGFIAAQRERVRSVSLIA